MEFREWLQQHEGVAWVKPMIGAVASTFLGPDDPNVNVGSYAQAAYGAGQYAANNAKLAAWQATRDFRPLTKDQQKSYQMLQLHN